MILNKKGHYTFRMSSNVKFMHFVINWTKTNKLDSQYSPKEYRQTYAEKSDVRASHVYNIVYPLYCSDHLTSVVYVCVDVCNVSQIQDVTCLVQRCGTL